jgi:hypothetical protein
MYLRIYGAHAEIRTEPLPNASLGPYRYTNLLDPSHTA